MLYSNLQRINMQTKLADKFPIIFSVSARPTTSPTIKLEHFPSISNGTTTRCFKTPDIGVSHITTTFIAHVCFEYTSPKLYRGFTLTSSRLHLDIIMRLIFDLQQKKTQS